MSVTNIRVRTTSESANPASARAASMIASIARAWAATSPVARPAVRAGVGRAGDPARIADDDRPAVAGHRLPGPARRDARRRSASDHRGRRARPGPPDPRRSPAAARRAASSAARSSRRRGTPPARDRCRRSGRGRRGSGRPSPPSCWRPTRRRSLRRRARSRGARRRPGRGRRGDRCGRASPSATSAPSARTVDGRVRDLGRLARSRGSPPRRSRALRGSTARTSTSSVAALGDDVRPRPAAITPTLTVTPGQRPLRSCRSRTIRRRLEDRAAALLRLDAGMRRPAVDRDPRRSRIPLRADTMSPFARAHSRTRPTSASRGHARGCAGVEVGEPISSSGLATKTSALERQAADARR